MNSHSLHRPLHQTHTVQRYFAHRLCRHASTSSNPYPYPSHPNPQPHQIFHLPRSATQQEIKDRYYDLVRIYHPDSPIARRYPADMAQARFQSIARAYDLMRGKNDITGEVMSNHERHTDPARYRPRTTRRPHFDETVGDERWKERILFAGTILAIVGFVAQTTVAHHKALVQATQSSRTSSSEPKRSLTDEALAEPTEPARPR